MEILKEEDFKIKVDTNIIEEMLDHKTIKRCHRNVLKSPRGHPVGFFKKFKKKDGKKYKDKKNHGSNTGHNHGESERGDNNNTGSQTELNIDGEEEIYLERHPIDHLIAGRHLAINKKIRHEYAVSCCKFNNTGKFLAVGLNNGKFSIVRCDLMHIDAIHNSGSETQSCTSLRWKPTDLDSQLMVTTNCDGTISGFSLKRNKIEWKINEVNKMWLCCDYQPEGKGFAVGDSNG